MKTLRSVAATLLFRPGSPARPICRVLALVFALPAFAQVPDTLRHTIPAPAVGAQSGARLGSGVAVDGGYTVVGAPFDDIGGQDSGVVKVFGSTSGALLLVLPNPSPVTGDRFGSTVSISGTLVVVGAYQDDTGAGNAGSAYVYDLSSGTPTVPVFTLNNPNPAVDDFFGTSVAISGTRVVVGARQDDTGATDAGSAYVYDVSGGTPTVPVFTLNNPGPLDDDQFGRSVAISGTRVVVGADGDDTGATDAGSAYVYDLLSGTPAVPVTTLNNPSPVGGDFFGTSVAMSGSRVVVGADHDNTGGKYTGSAYVYDLTSGTPAMPVTTLNNPNPEDLDFFGISVAISGPRVLVGASGDNAGAVDGGSAYVYDLLSGTPTVPSATLTPASQGAGDSFGASVAISGSQVVVGAPFEDTGATDAGSAYGYDVGSGTPTVPVAMLNNPGLGGGDTFGYAVAVAGTWMAVGAPFAGSANAGTVYVYDLGSATPTVPALTVNNPSPVASDAFGISVAISGTQMVVGAYQDDTGAANAGSAYVYDLGSATPAVPVTTLTNPNPAANERFGNAVAISGTRVVVGAYRDGTGATDSGSVYVYDLSGGTSALPVATLNNPSPAINDRFGVSVAIAGTRIVVGANGDDTGATDSGSAYVYDLSSGTPTTPVSTLNNPDPAMSDQFGLAVAIFGTRVVVGALQDDTGATDAGSAYVYDLSGGTPTVPVAVLRNPDPANADYFGISVAISGTQVIVGVYGDDTGAANAGSAYLYDLSSATPMVPVATLHNPEPTDTDIFGSSVAIDGSTVAIGSPFDDSTFLDKGAAYVFGPLMGQVVLGTDTDATGAGLPTGTKVVSFTAPDVGVVGGKVLTPDGKKLDAVFTEAGTVLLRGEQMMAVDPAGGAEMGMITKLAPPTGDAVLATLDRRGGVTAENDQVLFVGLKAGVPKAMARKGQTLAGLAGVKLKSFLTLDGNGETTFFSGKLSGTGVTSATSTAILAAGPISGVASLPESGAPVSGLRVLVRKGDMLPDGRKVKTIATLVGQAGTLAEGRWREGPNSLGMRLTFTDRTQALYLVPGDATGPNDWLLLGKTDSDAGPDLPGAMLLSFKLPAYAPGATVFDSLLRVGPGGITRKDNGAVFDATGVETGGPISLRRLAQRSGPAPSRTGVPVAGSGMARFSAMLAGLGRASSFVASSTLPEERGARSTIYDARSDGQVQQLARIGGEAPGGGRYGRFVSVAKPDGQAYGALVSALLGVSRPDAVTPRNRAALYGRDSAGEMRRLLRAGDQLESAGPGSALKTVKSFVALSAAAGSIGAARGYDDMGRVSVLVTFADRTQAVVRVQVP